MTSMSISGVRPVRPNGASEAGDQENVVPLLMTPGFVSSILGRVPAAKKVRTLSIPPRERGRKIVTIDGLDDKRLRWGLGFRV